MFQPNKTLKIRSRGSLVSKIPDIWWKSVIQNCYSFKRFRATHYSNAKPGLVPRARLEQILPFEIVGTDYAGPLYYEGQNLKLKRILKHISHYSPVELSELYIWSPCQILLLLSLSKVLRNGKSRKGKPNIIYSDSAKTFNPGVK